MNRLVKLCGALGFGLALLPGAHAQTSAKFVMDWAFDGPQAIWTAAAESGCYQKMGLDLKIDRGFGSGDAIGKVAAGAYDFGVADFTSLVAYNAQHPEQKLLGVMVVSDRTPTSVSVLKTSGISKPKDLEGKRIADSQGEASRVLFPAFAQRNGIDASKVEWVSVAPNLRQSSLVQGKADAAAGHMFTVQTGLQSLGVGTDKVFTMAYADYGVDVPGSTVIVRPAWAAAHPAEVRSFLTCAVVGIKASIANPKAAVDSLHKYNSMSDPKTDSEGLAFSTSYAIMTPYVKQHGLSQVDPPRMNLALTLVSGALSVPMPSLSDIWNGSYLPPASTMMLTSK